jgi:hypothetical protein
MNKRTIAVIALTIIAASASADQHDEIAVSVETEAARIVMPLIQRNLVSIDHLNKVAHVDLSEWNSLTLRERKLMAIAFAVYCDAQNWANPEITIKDMMFNQSLGRLNGSVYSDYTVR